MQDYFSPTLDDAALHGVSELALAHVGDAVFDLLIRAWLVERGLTTAAQLHRQTVARVSAPAQAAAVDRILPLLSPEEEAAYRRGRNAHAHGVPHNATPGQYARATGLEALFGWLFLRGQRERICQLFGTIMEAEDAL